MSRILLALLMGTVMMASLSSGAKGNECLGSLQHKLKRVEKTLKTEISRLGDSLSAIKSKDELRLYLADPKVPGGKDGRRDFFFLEAYGQILRHYKKGEGIRNNFREIVDGSFKVIEDKIGKYTEHIEVADAAKAFKMDPAFTDFLDVKTEKALSELYDFMVEEGWLGKNLKKLDEVKEAITELKWSEEKGRDHKLFFRALRDTFEAYHEKMEEEMKPVLKAKNWKYMENMEGGLHEVRRLFRWVMIIMQMRPEAFSYSKVLDPQNLALTGLELDVAKASLEDALERKSAMLDFAINKEGTAVVTPEASFYISGLVDRLGILKKKSELYFKLQAEIKLFHDEDGSMAGLNSNASDKVIQQYIIDASTMSPPGMSLQGYFVAGDSNPFQKIRQDTLELLARFWKLKSLVEFEEASDEARVFWDKRD